MPERSRFPQRHVIAGLVLTGLVAACALTPARGDGPATEFDRSVAPVLVNRCLECHNPIEHSGGLDLSTREGLLRGGKNGAVVEAGNEAESLLIERVAEGEMPPKKLGNARPLPAAEVARLRQWVASGASWPSGRVLDPFETSSDTRAGRDWWSLQPVKRPSVPGVRGGDAPDNPIDAFILARLQERGWTPAPPADRRTLIRRVYVDLVGYPPTYEAVEAFASDEAPEAYARLVDRLLASPHYGERWGRHWLDVARYAETCGYERDQPKPKVWKYRDWVIGAFNADLPFDRFVVDQLAGDEAPGHSVSSLVATGFLRLGTWNDEPNDPNEYKYERLEDMVHAASTAFLGMTVKCARCHDHKFDPIRQADYYRMAAAFWAGPIEPGPRELLGGPDAKSLGSDAFGWTDRTPTPPPLHLLKKGEPNHPGPVIEPGPLSMVPALDRPVQPPPPGSKTSRRRLQLAEWVVEPRNPLTARVWVNRLWKYHFGQGLVRSPDNFGFTGERPTHPELLDWLASELVEGGWRTKRLHRLIALSRTYRQASIHPRQDAYAATDTGNRLWWRAERQRLDAEGLRDALLAASGALDLARMGGPSFAPEIAAEALEGLSMKEKAWTPSPPAEQTRRAVYVFTKRGLLPPLMTAFDFPDTTLPCGQRDVTLVAPQALALLNNTLVHEQSQALARQILAASDMPEGRVRLARRRTLARDPRPSELAAAVEHMRGQQTRLGGREAERSALASLCHVLLNTNEFLFVD